MFKTTITRGALAAFVLMAPVSVQADMVAGQFICTPDQSTMRWYGSRPASLVTGVCGAHYGECRTTIDHIDRTARQLGCETAVASRYLVDILCTGSRGKLNRAIDRLCQKAIR